ncbi:MAG: signal peptidase II [Alphaproteobacteria bacterium]
MSTSGGTGMGTASPLRSGLAVAAAVMILDQFSKWWILERLPDLSPGFVLAPYLNLVLVLNRGISFGMFNNGSPYNSILLTALSLGVSLGLVFWLRKAENALMVVALGMILGGAVGNAVDRIRHDGVVDFIDFHVGAWHWPAFNVADSAITVGAVMMVVESMLTRPGARSA